MSILHRKLWRDLLHLRGQVAAIMVMVACGAMSYVALRTTWLALQESQQNYYSAYRFGDLFVGLKRAPESVREQVASIAGVEAVQSRIVTEVSMSVPRLNEPAAGRLISLESGSRGELNRIHLVSGQRPAVGPADEVVVSEAFAKANKLGNGDRISVVINGKWRLLRIVGIALSPEYIYEIRPGDLLPDPQRFGILWMNREVLESIFDLGGAFNEMSIALAPGADPAVVTDRLDTLLKRYGGFGAYDRDEQPSHRFISNELDELRVFCTWIPAIFLLVTAFLLHVVLSRLVLTQRDQIGVLKAFGFENRTIGIHYLLLSLVAVGGGILPGLGLGYLWGRSLAELYSEFFHFPVLYYRLDPSVMGLATLICGSAAVIGALGAVRRAVSIPTAEAMRPEPPTNFRPGLVERLGLQRWFPLSLRIILRNIERTPVRSGLTVLGLSLAVAVLFIGFYFYDAIGHIVRVEFSLMRREDLTLYFHKPVSPAASDDLSRLDGVLRVEGFRVVPVWLVNGVHRKRVAIMGLELEGELRQVIDLRETVHQLPPEGVILTERLAEMLGVGRGASLRVEVLEGERAVREVRVTGLVEDMMGLNAYMEIGALSRLMGDGGALSGTHLLLDPHRRDQLYRKFKETPGVKGLVIPEVMLDNFNRTLARTFDSSTLTTIFLAGILAFGLAYNAARIALSERGRELASLRVLGFTHGEVAEMLLGEQALLTLSAIAPGYLIGYGLCQLITRVIDTELLRLPLVLTPKTFVYSAAIVTLASLLSALLIRRRLMRLDIIEVLKTRE